MSYNKEQNIEKSTKHFNSEILERAEPETTLKSFDNEIWERVELGEMFEKCL